MYQYSLFARKPPNEKPLLILSLQPQYWAQVQEGKKKYEYRRLFRVDAVQAYIYLSSPRKEIAGFIDFDVPVIGSPVMIAELAESQSTGARQGILDYLGGLSRAFAVPILSHENIDPIPLSDLRSRFCFSAPQSYLVLDNFPDLRDYIQAHHYGKTKQ